MATLPSAVTVVQDTAGAVASGLDLIAVISPVPTSADATPRLFGSAAAIYAQHGYSEGVEYAALHVERTRKSILFVGVPIATVGEVGRVDTSGNSGTSVVSVVATGPGYVLAEHGGYAEVISGGIIGTDQIVLGISLDDGDTIKSVRLGTGNTYTIPYIGVRLDFAAGTLVAGDVIATWHGTAPQMDGDGIQAAREALAAQSKGVRTLLRIGDLLDADAADDYLTQLNAYETANERFVMGRASVYDRAPLAEMSRISARMTGSPSITFAEVGGTGDTITRATGSFITDGFAVGDIITVSGAVASAGANNVTGPIASLSATVITLGTTDLVAEGPISNVSIVAVPGITFAEVGATGDTITRNRGSWLEDGFRDGDRITITGSASNNITSALVTDASALVLTLDTQDLTAEAIGSDDIVVTAGQTKAAWMAEIEAEFEPVDDAPRINLSSGRARVRSPFSGWRFRRPVAWAASVREYQHDLCVATWRKIDGPHSGWDLFDDNGNLAEWDDRIDGGAACAARFTSFRTFANGPAGAFVALDLTRANDGSLLSYAHNEAVVNLACTTVHLNTERIIGRSLVLNDDGTATSESLAEIQAEVNRALERALLVDAGEGQRASKAVWSPNADDVFNVPEAVMTGVLDLVLNGTVHSVRTTVRVS
jgi:hypothetical protein